MKNKILITFLLLVFFTSFISCSEKNSTNTIKDNYEFTLDGSLEITVSTGSKNNLKPDFIMSGYREYIAEDIEYEIKRTKILYV